MVSQKLPQTLPLPMLRQSPYGLVSSYSSPLVSDAFDCFEISKNLDA